MIVACSAICTADPARGARCQRGGKVGGGRVNAKSCFKDALPRVLRIFVDERVGFCLNDGD